MDIVKGIALALWTVAVLIIKFVIYLFFLKLTLLIFVKLGLELNIISVIMANILLITIYLIIGRILAWEH